MMNKTMLANFVMMILLSHLIANNVFIKLTTVKKSMKMNQLHVKAAKKDFY